MAIFSAWNKDKQRTERRVTLHIVFPFFPFSSWQKADLFQEMGNLCLATTHGVCSLLDVGGRDKLCSKLEAFFVH